MKLNSFGLFLPVLLMLTISVSLRSQQPAFTVAGIRPYDKAVPGQVMEVLIEGLGSRAAPMIIPETDFKVEVLQDGTTQKAKVRITKFTMIRELNADTANRKNVDFGRNEDALLPCSELCGPKGTASGPCGSGRQL